MVERLLPIHKITDLTLRANAVEREFAMIKVMGKAPRSRRTGDLRLDGELCARAYRPRAKCGFRPRQPSFSFAVSVSKNESPLSTIRL
jgi:hypothetical protein